MKERSFHTPSDVGRAPEVKGVNPLTESYRPFSPMTIFGPALDDSGSMIMSNCISGSMADILDSVRWPVHQDVFDPELEARRIIDALVHAKRSILDLRADPDLDRLEGLFGTLRDAGADPTDVGTSWTELYRMELPLRREDILFDLTSLRKVPDLETYRLVRSGIERHGFLLERLCLDPVGISTYGTTERELCRLRRKAAIAARAERDMKDELEMLYIDHQPSFVFSDGGSPNMPGNAADDAIRLYSSKIFRSLVDDTAVARRFEGVGFIYPPHHEE